MQHNEVINLNLAVASIDCVVITPEEYFSFCRLVGRPRSTHPTDRHFQLKVNVAEQQLEGELLCDQARQFRYHVYQLAKYAVDEVLLEMLVGI
ncbi:hypothetical protein [Pseudomonas sp. LB3P25]